MGDFFMILFISALYIGMCFGGFYKMLGPRFDYWSDRQYRNLRMICCSIGVLFLITIIAICVLSQNRFSEAMNVTAAILMILELLSMILFSQIIRFIAWKGKTKLLKQNIREAINENCTIDKKELLDICLYENRENYTTKEIKKNFEKLTKH